MDMKDSLPAHQNLSQTFWQRAEMLLTIISAIAAGREYPTPLSDSVIEAAGGGASS
jgi:hypothetical protein